MNILNRLLSNNYTSLKIFILALVSFIILSTEIFNHYYFHKLITNSIFDGIVSLLLAIILVLISFYIIGIKQKQLNDQISQLTDAYQYIGQINRKIDALLEIDLSSLDHSNNLSHVKTVDIIFNQLMTLIQAHSGYLHLKPPFNFKLQKGQSDKELNRVFEKLMVIGSQHFKYSRHPESGEFFKSLEIPEELIKRYHFVTKPVYMHNQDVGTLLLIFENNRDLEERDLNIIRIFSFYLALNATFKPNFSHYRT